MMRFFALATLVLSATSAFADQTRTVNCGIGQSLTLTLATLNKLQPATVTVQGTCTEYVLIDGFENLNFSWSARCDAFWRPRTDRRAHSTLLCQRK